MFTKKYSLANSRDARIIMLKLKLFGKVSFIIAQFKLASCRYNQDSRTWTKEMNETRKIEDFADESSNSGQRITSDTEDLRDDKNQEAKNEKIILSTDFCTYQLTRTITPSDRRDSMETLSKLSNSNLGKTYVFFYSFLIFIYIFVVYLFILYFCFLA